MCQFFCVRELCNIMNEANHLGSIFIKPSQLQIQRSFAGAIISDICRLKRNDANEGQGHSGRRGSQTLTPLTLLQFKINT